MRMMFSKHGLWKFVDGSATILNDEDEMTNYNEKETKAFALLCEHLIDAQPAHIQYCENVKSIWETLCDAHKAKTIKNKLFSLKEALHHQNEKKGRFAYTHQHGEGTYRAITFH